MQGGFAVGREAGMLRRAGVPVALRPRTFQLLCCLAAEPGRLFTREELLERLWPGLVVVDDSLTQCIVELRRAFGEAGREIVQTVPRRGYRLSACLEGGPADIAQAWVALHRIESARAIAGARLAFERAYERGEDRAAALAGISLSHVVDVLNRWSNAPAWQAAIARDAADEALAREPDMAMANHARAHVSMIEGRYVEARAGFRRAIGLDASLDHARVRLAIIEMELGYAERALESARAVACAARERPQVASQASFVQAMAAFHLGRDGEAQDCLDHALALVPGTAFAHQWSAAILALHGREDSAHAHLKAFQRRVPGHTLASLQASERSRNETFRQQRSRFYEGLARAGMPRH